ncbi:hypothetical protein BWQ96_07848 [Gracilariopsis chorda]|uniref:Uncharacterized protein n=1 Tax=Gracilariopsis chorda TaxID=448386 RepID=A0A2V3IK09_9FLOR|nr:hypothetical protein BWQ96_07848 [Gracilariopsis chorda]|eukprot:PXF42407.1 hypothetical protein BWQ96_07848 [Gracilariopsis chorda]
MPRMVYTNILKGALVESDYFRKLMQPNAVGKLGISPLVKVICALRQISHDIPSDLAEDMCDVSETTASLCLDEFCKAVESHFRAKYLQDPTDEDLIRTERQFARVGFPGCIGCVDCGGWEWKSCPKALQGVMIGKEGKPTLRMELICYLDMWIWAFQFGLPEGFNDLNILELSTFFNKILAGSFPTVKPSYTVSGIGIDWY